MSTPPSRKRPADDHEGDRFARPATKRQRSRSPSSTGHFPQPELDTSTEEDRRISDLVLDPPDHHVRLQDFSVELQKAAKAAAAAASSTLLDETPEYPRFLFSIQVSDKLETRGSRELFTDMLGIKMARFARVEAGFVSDSTLILISICPALREHLPKHLAMTLVGTIKSRNLMSTSLRNSSPETVPAASGSQGLEKVDVSKGMMAPPATSPKKEEPPNPKGGCRYIMFREDVRPMACQCQGFSQDFTASITSCECGHKPCYHLATRSQTMYRQELEALTKKVYKLEQDVRRMKVRRGAISDQPFSSEEREMIAFRGGMYVAKTPSGMHDMRGHHFQSRPEIPEPEIWNFRGP